MDHKECIERARGLLKGALDLHVHSGPDCFGRIFSHDELAKHAQQYGLYGVVLKAHHQGTADRVPFVKKLVPDIQVFGGITLNHAVGGLNPAAVETAIEYGAKVVWLPTIDALNHVIHYGEIGTYDSEIPIAWKRRVASKPIKLLNENGCLKEAMHEILELVSAADVILSVGHVSYPEILEVLKVAKKVRLEKILVDHPVHPVMGLSLAQQSELVSRGALLNYVSCDLYWREGPVSPAQFVNNIKKLGLENVVISSDGGALGYPPPYEMFLGSIQVLIDADFSDAEIRQMICNRPKALIS